MKYLKIFENFEEIDPFGEEEWEEPDEDLYYILGLITGDGEIHYTITKKMGDNFYVIKFGENGVKQFLELNERLITHVNQSVFDRIMNDDYYITYFLMDGSPKQSSILKLLDEHDINRDAVLPHLEDVEITIEKVIMLSIKDGEIVKTYGRVENDKVISFEGGGGTIINPNDSRLLHGVDVNVGNRLMGGFIRKFGNLYINMDLDKKPIKSTYYWIINNKNKLDDKYSEWGYNDVEKLIN